MNKYEILENKLSEVSIYIDGMNIKDEATYKYLISYKEYVDKMISEIRNRKIVDSNGARLGLVKGVSDYDEICEDKKFWYLITEADNYYCNECKNFK